MTMDTNELPNLAWHAMNEAQSRFTIGNNRARRYANGFPPIAALRDPARPDPEALRALMSAGEVIHLAGAEWTNWPGLVVEHETQFHQMVWEGKVLPDFDLVAVSALQTTHAECMERLVERTRPGPYGPRAWELGRFVGIFAHGDLVAMAGTRMRTDSWQEISTVCTDPDHAGRGLATVLVRHLLRRTQSDGLRSVLHVEHTNKRALELYRQIGFVSVRTDRLLTLRREN